MGLRASVLLLCVCALLSAQSATETPKPFAPGIVPPGALGLAFSPDGKTLYFSQPYTRILSARFENGAWSAPTSMPFTGPYRDGDPFVSPDGSRLFFWSSRPVPGRQVEGLTLWSAERTVNGWGEPKELGPSINAGGGSVFASVTREGTLYFTSGRKGSLGQRDIYRARGTAEGYAEPENLGPPISSPDDEWDAYIAPDESYLVFASSRGGGPALYISERKDGAWTAPRDLRPAIGNFASCCPAVSPDGKHFFFTGRDGIYRTGIGALGLSKEPFSAPEPFPLSAPGSFAIAFSPDGRNAYFTDSGAVIMTSRFENGAWSAPRSAMAESRFMDIFPFPSRDGKRLFFSSNRPRQSPGIVLWVKDGDNEPAELGAPVNANALMNGSGSVAANGTLYFAAQQPGAGFDLFRARPAGKGFAPPESLGPAINTAADEREVYVAPDESFILFTSVRAGSPDLYIAFNREGRWTEPRSLGPEINTPAAECCATMSPDGKKLYFVRQNGPSRGVFEVTSPALH
jgi:Tol biopolymer transport system component